MDMENLWDRISFFFVKHQCVFCDNYPDKNALWCGQCSYTKVGRIRTLYANFYTDAIAAIEYSGNAKSAIWRLKEEGDKRAERFFAGEMHQQIRQHWPSIPFDLVVPVPMSALRQAKRGHNQAILLARRLAAQMAIPMEPAALRQQEGMRTQHQLPAKDRIDNAKQAYVIHRPSAVQDRTILLVDDIITTGATVDTCAKLLLDAGAKAVYAVAAQCPPQD